MKTRAPRWNKQVVFLQGGSQQFQHQLIGVLGCPNWSKPKQDLRLVLDTQPGQWHKLPVYMKKEKNTMAVSSAQVEKYLQGVDYPTRKADLIKQAQQNGAPPEVMNLLRQLPEETYQKPTDVTQAIGAIK